ncbi:MAG: Asp23/Gls24 family envelope stress response protein [Clostridia bacterium]|nr:Asp23/Gls24 family envelope stress response protein [Clostridia bacterium]
MVPENIISEGNIEVSEAVLITFVEKTVGEFDGISLSRKRKSVKVTKSDSGCTIDMGLDVNYGVNIPEIVKQLQAAVTERITKLAGVKVREVNVVVEGLNIEDLITK